ncbi:hypothetical protein BJV78DRAFT_195680 [Lactifluus subvellereus]|nr:hypothetical protein BJV78DRAFT_195680 [Lactifluus subvellereus]
MRVCCSLSEFFGNMFILYTLSSLGLCSSSPDASFPFSTVVKYPLRTTAAPPWGHCRILLVGILVQHIVIAKVHGWPGVSPLEGGVGPPRTRRRVQPRLLYVRTRILLVP